MRTLGSKIRCCGGIPLFGVVVFLSLATRILTGDLGIDRFHYTRWAGIGVLLLFFVLITLVLDFVDSLLKVRHFADPQTRQVKLKPLWREVFTNPLTGIIILFFMLFGVANAQDWSEVYRQSVVHWHDPALWRLEEGVILYLQDSFLNIPWFWDFIYLSFWNYLLLVFAILYKNQKYYDLGIASIAIVVSFFLTRWIALYYPTAGPVFYRPEFFDLAGTSSFSMQEMLRAYMAGEIGQNGFIPGTMGMPSLHVGLTFLATGLLAWHVRWTLWLTLPWSCLIWLSTVMLGWHYILDGLGGLGIAACSVLLACVFLKMLEAISLRVQISNRQVIEPVQ